MEPDQRSSFLFGRIFCDEPVSTSSENALDGQHDLADVATLVEPGVRFCGVFEREC